MDTWLTKRTDTRSGGQPVSTVLQCRYAVRIADGAENQTIYPVAGPALPPARIGTQFVGPFAFSLRRDRALRAELASLQPDIPEPLKVIANVVAYSKPDYAIDSSAIETLAGHRVYHLQLRPLRMAASTTCATFGSTSIRSIFGRRTSRARTHPIGFFPKARPTLRYGSRRSAHTGLHRASFGTGTIFKTHSPTTTTSRPSESHFRPTCPIGSSTSGPTTGT